jgi:hypothetical protein
VRGSRWLAAFAALMFCWSLSGCDHPETGSLDMSKTKLGLEGEVMPKKAAPGPANAKRN